MLSHKNFNIEYFKKLPIGLIILLALFIGSIWIFTAIAHEVLWEKEEKADQYVFSLVDTHFVNNKLTAFMDVVTHFASGRFLQIGYVVIILLYIFLKQYRRSVEIAAIGIGGYIINYVMKNSFQRIRPPDPLIEPLQNFSFPSGHATSGFIFYGLLAYLAWKSNIPKIYKYSIGSILVLFSLLIGFSRIYLRLHYPSDVAAGFCIGFAWLLLTIWVFEKLKKKSGEELKADD